jgi:hypothetical protein
MGNNLFAVNSVIKTSTNPVMTETLFCSVQSKLKPYDTRLADSEHTGLKPETSTISKFINLDTLILTASAGGPHRGFPFFSEMKLANIHGVMNNEQ